MIEVLAPDGSIVKFPEGTPDDVILRVMRENYGSPEVAPSEASGVVAEPMAAPPAGDALELMRQAGLAGAVDTGPASFAEMQRTASEGIGADTQERIAPYVDPFLALTQGLTYGYSDEIASRAMAGMGRVPQEEIAGDLRGQLNEYRDRAPVQAVGLEILGALSNPLSRLGPGQGSLPAQMGQGAAAGGLLGYLYGTGTEEGEFSERALGAVDEALFGGGIGLALPAVGAAVGRGVDAFRNSRAMREAARAAPSMDDIRAAATRLYDQADSAVMPRSGLLGTAQQVQDDAARMALDPMLTPQAARVVDNVTDAATSPDPNITFRELDILRRQAGIAAGDMANRPQAAIGAQIQEAIDAFVDNADPQTSAVLKEARDMWGRLRRSEIVERAIEAAGRQASGFENGLRVQFRQILNNPRVARTFTQAEREAMEQVVRGTPLGNAMRTIGKLGLDLRQNTNALGASLGAVMGGTFGGGPGAILVPAAASVARRAAETTTRNAADRLIPMIASGGVPNVRQIAPAIREATGLLGSATARVLSPELGLLELMQKQAQ